MGGPGRRAAVLGLPIAHSLSPVLHRAAYRALGLDWSYDAIEVDEPGLAAFLAGCDATWAGLSLTMPLKTAVLDLLDEVDPLAATVGAVNTVLFQRGRRRGANTDAPGMAAALRGAGAVPGPVAVLGAGATARSALAALAALGVPHATVYARRPEVAHGLEELGAALAIDVRVEPFLRADEALLCDLVVSTVPAGGADELAGAVPAGAGLLHDVLYHPWPTPLARSWAAHDGVVVGGLDLLVHQAALQVELMTGLPAPLEVMQRAGQAALGRD